MDERFEVEQVLAERESFSRYVVRDARDGVTRLIEIQRVSPGEGGAWSARAALALRLRHPSLLACLEAELTRDQRGVLVFDTPPSHVPLVPFTAEQTLRAAVSVASVLTLLHRVGLVFGTPIAEPAFWDSSSKGLDIRVEVLARAVAGHRREPLCAQALLYVPPEITAGGDPAPRSDLFVLGTLLYRMLMGSAPPAADPPELHIDDLALAEEVLKLLDRDPARRPASSAEACRSFTRLLKARRSAAGPPPSFGWVANDAAGDDWRRARTYVVPELNTSAVTCAAAEASDFAQLESLLVKLIWSRSARSGTSLDEARAYYRGGEVTRALKAIGATGGDEARLLRSVLLWRTGRPREASELVNGLASDEARLLEATLMRERGELDRAEELVCRLPVDSASTVGRGSLLVDCGRFEPAVAAFHKAVALALDPAAEARARGELAALLARIGQLRQATEEVTRARGLLVQGEDEIDLRTLRVSGAEVDFQAGRWASALEALEVEAGSARERGDAWLLLRALALLARLELALGREAAAIGHIEECLKLARERQDREARLAARVSYLEVHALRGDWEALLGRARALSRVAGTVQYPRHRAEVLRWGARAAVALGQIERARTWLSEACLLAESLSDPVLHSALDAIEALALCRDGKTEAALHTFERAIAHLEGMSQPYAQARLYAEFVSEPWTAVDTALIRLRRDAAARIARELGAVPLLKMLGLDAGVSSPRSTRSRERPGIIAESRAMQEVLEQVERAAPFNVALHLSGESGTGKELLARTVHLESPRAKKAFVALNCAALPDALLEAEIFGHARGAFTGADRPRAGLLEEAEGGTLFLDEVADLSPRGQTLLLRVLQEKEYRRLGESALRRADVRVISATHKCLEDEARAARFREDLLFRLKVVSIVVPPLRERVEDILPLAWHSLARRSVELGLPQPILSDEAAQALLRYTWPGNVRQLENAITQALLRLGSQKALSPAHLSPELRGRTTSALRSASSVLERKLVEQALARHDGNRTLAARELGLTRQALYGKLKKHRLSPQPGERSESRSDRGAPRSNK